MIFTSKQILLFSWYHANQCRSLILPKHKVHRLKQDIKDEKNGLTIIIIYTEKRNWETNFGKKITYHLGGISKFAECHIFYTPVDVLSASFLHHRGYSYMVLLRTQSIFLLSFSNHKTSNLLTPFLASDGPNWKPPIGGAFILADLGLKKLRIKIDTHRLLKLWINKKKIINKILKKYIIISIYNNI